MKSLNRILTVCYDVEEARGLSEENFKSLTSAKQIKYIKEHPTSKYAKEPKWLKRAKMLKTRIANMKNAIRGSKPTKSVSTKKSVAPTTSDKERYGNYPYITDPKQIKKILKGLDYKLNKDGTVDVNGNVGVSSNLYDQGILDDNGHLKVKFGKVVGDFYINVTSVSSLEGCPKEVTGDFSCHFNHILKSLKGCPEVVNGDFYCNLCSKLTSLKYAPKKTKSFYCMNCNSLKSLKGAPFEVGGDFNCEGCYQLKSLEGGPNIVLGEYKCGSTGIKSLKGAPSVINSFSCSNCSNLNTLEGSPQEGYWFNFENTAIENLKGGPKKVAGNLRLKYNRNLVSMAGSPEILMGKIICDDRMKPLFIHKYGKDKVA